MSQNQLPRFSRPLAVAGIHRAFELSDDSMPPLSRGTTIVARYVESWHTVSDGTACIVVTQQGIQYRRLFGLGTSTLELRADNPVELPRTLPLNDVLEIWEAKAFISNHYAAPAPTLEGLRLLVDDLTQQVKRLRP